MLTKVEVVEAREDAWRHRRGPPTGTGPRGHGANRASTRTRRPPTIMAGGGYQKGRVLALLNETAQRAPARPAKCGLAHVVDMASQGALVGV